SRASAPSSSDRRRARTRTPTARPSSRPCSPTWPAGVLCPTSRPTPRSPSTSSGQPTSRRATAGRPARPATGSWRGSCCTAGGTAGSACPTTRAERDPAGGRQRAGPRGGAGSDGHARAAQVDREVLRLRRDRQRVLVGDDAVAHQLEQVLVERLHLVVLALGDEV